MIWISFFILFCRLFYSEFQLFSPHVFQNNFFHLTCVQWTVDQNHPALFKGLFCGSNNIDTSTLSLFQKTGLYHLLVVSGSHLVFLEKIMDKFLREHIKTKLVLFFIFSITCQMNPPIVRAFLGQVVRYISLKKFLYINDDAKILTSGLWCLILFPQWIHSTSLLLSWMASLALNYKIAGWKKHFIIAFYFLPWTQHLSVNSIFNNLLFGFVFEYLLFPVSFVIFLTPGLSSLGNNLWAFTYLALNQLPPVVQTMDFSPAFSYWPYLFIFHILHRLKK